MPRDTAVTPNARMAMMKARSDAMPWPIAAGTPVLVQLEQQPTPGVVVSCSVHAIAKCRVVDVQIDQRVIRVDAIRVRPTDTGGR